jgi:hypothetical protein
MHQVHNTLIPSANPVVLKKKLRENCLKIDKLMGYS